ncbi:hypothetical protein [Vibrio penaeicida]|nr:hypothetical protein [Vibrio penaeicida]
MEASSSGDRRGASTHHALFPAALWEDWQEAICHGAASRLYAVPVHSI